MLFVRSLLLTMLSLTLISCATTSGNNKKSGEEELKVYLFADEDVNKDVYNIPSPTRMTFLQLASVIEFNQLNEITNDDNYAVHLGDSVLDEINVVIKPEEILDFELPLKEGTKYIGVIAAFQDTNNDWKLALRKQLPVRWQRNVNFLYLNVRANDIAQLSKDDAVLKIASQQLQEKGEDINSLEDFEKKKLLRNTAKDLTKKRPKDMSKGLFLQANDKKPKFDIADIKLDTDAESSVDALETQTSVAEETVLAVEEANLSIVDPNDILTIEQMVKPKISVIKLMKISDSLAVEPVKTLQVIK